MESLLIANPSQIVSPWPGVLRGPELATVRVTTGASILINNGTIVAMGPWAELKKLPQTREAEILDATGRAVIPGLVDCHSHLVFGGSRLDDFSLRTRGVDYPAIAAQGGGIVSTVAATRRATKEELKKKGHDFLARARSHGTTTMEIKSGYGLDLKNELKLLTTIAELNGEQPLDLIPTFLGAHCLPADVSKEAYLQQVHQMLPEVARHAVFCDVFCEQGYFSPAESAALLQLAKNHGLIPRLHGDQFHSIGCIATAIEADACSIDHLEVISDTDIEALAATRIVSVVLPGVSLFLDIPYAPARKMLDAGCIMAIGSDFNPGSNMCLSLPLMMSLACTQMGMTMDEALCATTQNAAAALRLTDRGCIEPGYQADLLLLTGPDYREMLYFYGENHIHRVIKKGEVL